jgi:zinc transport system substrate-binding protein
MRIQAFILLIIITISACTNYKPAGKGVVATTAWTAAYAMAAGATDVSVLAPYEMVHPSEYELRPGDIVRLNNASIIVYAGYEVMVDQIKTGLNISEKKLMKIETNYYADEIENSVMLIARQLGTEATARKNIKEIRELLSEGKHRVQQKGLDKQTTLVHFFQESFAKELGIDTRLVFGPAPPEPRQILDFTHAKPSLIIDNVHNPVGRPMRETIPDSKYIMLLNFPGMYGTRSLADVIEYNLKQMDLKISLKTQ